MASGQTTHYGLNQWQPEDAVLRTDFNADNAKTDTALNNLQQLIGTKEAALAAAIAGCYSPSNPYLTSGTYVGTCFDASSKFPVTIELGFRPSMLVVLDSVFNRIIRNRRLGRSTWVYIDEIYLLFQHEYSANFLFTLWKRVRKYGACCTGLTQNVDDLLHAGQQRIPGHAQPGEHRPGRAGPPAQYLGQPAFLHHQCGLWPGAHQVRQRHRALYGPFPQE